MFLTGAGISVNSGIPDFRSPKSGLYAQIKELGFVTPEEVFDLRRFALNPTNFYQVSNKLIKPDLFTPTDAHYFMKLIFEKGNLLMIATQNIDSLELKAGIPNDYVFQAHGHSNSAHCLCGHPADIKNFIEHVNNCEVMYCDNCKTPVKPDVVFFGEDLPAKFSEMKDVSNLYR